MSRKQARSHHTLRHGRNSAQAKTASSADDGPFAAPANRPQGSPSRAQPSLGNPPPLPSARKSQPAARQAQAPADHSTQSLSQRQTNAVSSSTAARHSWKRWPETTIKVDGLPLKVTTKDLWAMFSREGRIVWMEIFENEQNGHASVRIRFEPAPKNDFWSAGRLRRTRPDSRDGPRALELSVSLLPPPRFGRAYAGGTSLQRGHAGKMMEALCQLDFVSTVGPTAMAIKKSIMASTASPDMRLELDVRYKRLTVYFSTRARARGWKGTRQFRVQIGISSITTIYQVLSPERGVAWVLPLPRPPQYFWKLSDADTTLVNNPQIWSENDTWFRATDIAENLDLPMTHPVAVHNVVDDKGYIEIGRWTTFRLTLANSPDPESQSIQQLRMALEDLNVSIVHCDNFAFERGGKTMWDYLDHHRSTTKGQTSALLQMAAPSIIHLAFGVRYQLEVCVSRGVLNEHTVGPDFLQALAALKPSDAARRLEYLADQNMPVFDPMELFANLDAQSYVPNASIPYYCTLVQKAIVTPTTVRFNSPTVETSNRVVRKYSHMQDRFLRVQFTEEAEQARLAGNRLSNDQPWKRVLRALYNGIRIGDRVYEFLGFGSSQLRQSGAYFFCPTEHVSCEDIRQWMGDFNHIRVVAKYAARLGQCFSTTREIRSICQPSVRHIPDIDKEKYCFTDGVGIISEFLAKFIIEEMHLDILEQPTAFQFRMGGCKGVLTVWPQARGMEVLVRESQEKFKAKFNGLEIVRCARFSSATLNRQTITILESLGVPAKAFIKLLEKQITDFETAMEHNSVAVRLLTKFVDENRSTLVLADMIKAGFKSEDVQEPFTMNLLKLWRAWSLKLLKEKARIHVPKSAFVMGCVDESGTLRGHSRETESSTEKDVDKLPQIFLQLTDPARCDRTIIITGVCLVGRNPSLHPGDIRIVEAVDNPANRHLKDVVVFSSKGDRPVPNMLSGGDLDGDDFFVVWDPDLIPKEWNFPPMNYEGPQPPKLSRDVNADDIRDFFVKYMKYNVLPLIAHAHLAHADLEGPKSQTCLLLAELHSKAVDYPKTGEPAELGQKLQPKKWPHFMEKKNSYTSKRALGLIYDKVVKRTVEFRPDWQTGFDQRIIKRFEHDEETLDLARSIKKQYDVCVRRVLAQHDVATEFELYTAWAMTTPETENQYKRQETLGREYDILKTRFRDRCEEATGGKPDKFERLVAAMYVVTEQETKLALAERSCAEVVAAVNAGSAARAEAKTMPLISLPWIYPGLLVQIATGVKHEARKSRLADGWNNQSRLGALPSLRPHVSGVDDHDGESTSAPSTSGGAESLDAVTSAELTGISTPNENADIDDASEKDGGSNGQGASGQEPETSEHDDGDAETTGAGRENENGNAMDRLASLMGFDEVDGFD